VAVITAVHPDAARTAVNVAERRCGRWGRVFTCALITGLFSCAVAAGDAGSTPECLGASAGAYTLPSGEVIVLTMSAKPAGLRWTHDDGRTGLLQPDPSGGTKATRGWTTDPDTTVIDLKACDATCLLFEGQTARRLELDIQETAFDVDGVRIAGRLVRPVGRRGSPVPLVIEVQGSGRGSHIDSNHRQFQLPAHGIAVFVYDKRGTGRSTGQYTQDFHVLARDAAAAFTHASGLMGEGAATRGFIGSSQGGWVAPLAAAHVPAGFVIVNYGLAYSALQEDREQVLLGMRRAGWNDPEILRKAAAVADAAGRVVTRKGEEDMRRVAQLREMYRPEAWWKDLGGEFTVFIANTSAEELARLGPAMDVGTSWEYDPMPTLRALEARQLWLVAGKDAEAPPEETLRRLDALQREGKPVTVVTFPEADHGLRRFQVVDGKRREVGYETGAHRVIIDWIRGIELAPRAGETFVVAPPR
jgi:uncharacterized protein